MPHKHTRRGPDLSTVDLPPTQIARPLPTAPAPKKIRSKQTSTTKSTKPAANAPARGTKRKRDAKGTVSASTKTDDAPRAFKRLMALASGKRVRSGLDSGIVETKKQKKKKAAQAAAAAAAAAGGETEAGTGAGASAGAAPESTPASNVPTIRPGERLSEFASRVDAALPLSGLIAKSGAGNGGKDPLGIEKTYRTRQERKLHKLYDQWREEDRRIKDRLADEQELAEEQQMELDESLGVKWRLDFQQATTKKKKKAAGGSGGGSNNHADDDDDLWAEFNRKKGAATKSTVRAGIHGVVTAPPELTKIDSNKFKFAQQKKEGGGAGSAEVAAAAARLSTLGKTPGRLQPVVSDVPKKSVGGLGDRQELEAARKDVLASYRRLAAGRRKQHRGAATEA